MRRSAERAGSGVPKQALFLAQVAWCVLAVPWLVPAAQRSTFQEGSSGEAVQNANATQEPAASLPKGKKLFLKDGSFHIVREYEQKGDRVRYYSVERSAWEEIPAELVDWEATRKAEAAEAQRQQEAVEKIKAIRAGERATAADVEVDASIEVAHGVFLPPGEGMFVVEGREVTPMSQAAADAKLDKGRLMEQILVPVPVVPTRFRIRVPGKRAVLRLSTVQPEFYMRTADAREPEMELIRADIKGDVRQIETLSVNIAEQRHEKRKAIAVERWRLAKGVYRFTLSQPLAPGEYAFAEILPDGMNLNVWDFGVDASGAPQGRSGQTQPKQ